MNKKLKRVTYETIARWRDSLMRTGPADIEAAKNLIKKVYPNTQIFVVDTPAQFYVAQGVIRKRVSKKYAKATLCKLFGIDDRFVDELKGVGRPLEILNGRTWQRMASNTITDRIVAASMEMACNDMVVDDSNTRGTDATVRNVRAMRQRWLRTTTDPDTAAGRMTQYLGFMNPDPVRLYRDFMALIPDVPGSYEKNNAIGAMNFDRTLVENACLSISSVLSNHIVDIVTDDGRMYDPDLHRFDATQAEIMCRMLGCKDMSIQITYELFHHVPAIMKFNGAILLLGNRPEVKLNAEGQPHSETGRAVNYGDGTGFWFIDGHKLFSMGQKIVMAPETLTKDDIASINNEEEKRIAIDRFGWEKYMKALNAKIIDKRENWIDNTVEVLIQVPQVKKNSWERDVPLQAVLACRSTGRRYVIAVPPTVESGPRGSKKSERITNCDKVQEWMANGAQTEYLNYAKLPVRVIGAS